MIQNNNFIKLCSDLSVLSKQYERGEIKHYDYMTRYDATINNYGFTKEQFIKQLSIATNKKLHSGK